MSPLMYIKIKAFLHKVNDWNMYENKCYEKTTQSVKAKFLVRDSDKSVIKQTIEQEHVYICAQ